MSLSQPYSDAELFYQDYLPMFKEWDMSDINLAKLRAYQSDGYADDALGLAPLIVRDEVTGAEPSLDYICMMNDYSATQNGDGSWPQMAWHDPQDYYWEYNGNSRTQPSGWTGGAGAVLHTGIRTGEVIAHNRIGSDRHFWFSYDKYVREPVIDSSNPDVILGYSFSKKEHGGYSDYLGRMPDAALRWMNNAEAQYEPQPVHPVDTFGNRPQGWWRQDSTAIVGGKFLMAVNDFNAVNFGRPCGADKFAVDQTTVCAITATAGNVFTVKITQGAAAPLATGGLSVGDFILIESDGLRQITGIATTSADANGEAQWLVTCGAVIENLPTGYPGIMQSVSPGSYADNSQPDPILALTEAPGDFTPSGHMGRLRWPFTPGVCGRIGITCAFDSGTGLVTITTAVPQPYLLKDPATGDIRVDLFDSPMTDATKVQATLTRVDDSNFTFTHAAMPDYVWLTGRGVGADYSKYQPTTQNRTGVYLQWSFDQRLTAKANAAYKRYLAANPGDVTGAQAAYNAVVVAAGVPANFYAGVSGVTGATKTQFNYNVDKCAAVIGIVPHYAPVVSASGDTIGGGGASIGGGALPVENFVSQVMFDYPGLGDGFDAIFGSSGQAAIYLTMPDPFWQQPYKPTGTIAINSSANFRWTQDIGVSQLDEVSGGAGVLKYRYFAHHPLVEALKDLPSGASLPAGLSLYFNQDIPPPYYPLGFAAGGDGSYGSVEMDWSFIIRACGSISGALRFGNFYSQFLKCFNRMP